MDAGKLKNINSAYKGNYLPHKQKTYTINIPEEKIYAFYLRYELENQSDVLNTEYMISYYVKLGDTLEKIAKKYDTDIRLIMRTNYMDEPYLEVGQLLILPVNKEKFEYSQ